ncbi:Hsp70 family protein [Actinoplanes sp. DH11]|uniref:Hsp70 family protein n=1 Tax=Actinoplanes sp. DH11 TaxID=2857011 RepID=UPI001E37C797|nr:Hsp70 family protein [Actinoplanes sp. DH11]
MSIDQGGPKRYALGIDFGTSNTVAVARWPDGRARPILVDGSPLLPSAVYADAAGNLLVGRDAVHSARLDPARFEPNPKRRVDDGTVLLGEREFETVELITAVLARVVEEWHRAVGPYRPQTTLTCPASWGSARRTLLAEAAARAGLEGARLVAEPVAAATYFAEVLGRDVPIGSVVVVHDFGAGTFDASVVARTSTGFEVLAVDGQDDLGGLDVDAAIVEHLRTDDWQRLMAPATVEERRARRQLWDDVRIAKERLSRAQAADFMVPLLDTEAHLTREELEAVARPVLEQTVQITRNLLRWADLPEGRLAGVFLVGGASRIPLVATLLHRELGDPPVVIEQPELVVAEGSILADGALLTSEPAAPGPTEEMRLPSRHLPPHDLVVETEVAVRAAAAAGSGIAGSGVAGPTEERPAVTTPVTVRPSEELAAEAEAATVLAARPGTEPESAGHPEPLKTERLGESAAAPADSLPRRTPQPVEADAGREPAPFEADAFDPDTPPHLRPPVDPWPHADPSTWRSDPDATAATSPPRNDGWPAPGVPPKQATGTPRATRQTPPVVAHARPISPSGAAARPASPVMGSARPVPPARAVAAAPRASQRHPARPQPPGPDPQPEVRQRKGKQRPAKQPKQKKPKRRGRFLRGVQILLSMLAMIVVPLVALVLAYGYANGAPLEQDAVNVFEDIARLIGW